MPFLEADSERCLITKHFDVYWLNWNGKHTDCSWSTGLQFRTALETRPREHCELKTEDKNVPKQKIRTILLVNQQAVRYIVGAFWLRVSADRLLKSEEDDVQLKTKGKGLKAGAARTPYILA